MENIYNEQKKHWEMIDIKQFSQDHIQSVKFC